MVWLHTENQLPKLPIRASKFCMGVWVVAGGVGWWSEVVIEDKHKGKTFLSILINCSKTKKRGGWFKDDISPSVFIKEMH